MLMFNILGICNLISQSVEGIKLTNEGKEGMWFYYFVLVFYVQLTIYIYMSKWPMLGIVDLRVWLKKEKRKHTHTHTHKKTTTKNSCSNNNNNNNKATSRHENFVKNIRIHRSWMISYVLNQTSIKYHIFHAKFSLQMPFKVIVRNKIIMDTSLFQGH